MVSIWVEYQNSGVWTGIFGKSRRDSSSVTKRNFHLSLNPNQGVHHRFHDESSGNSGIQDTPNGSITISEWCHIAIVNDGSTAKIYINGVEQASGAVTGSLVVHAHTIDLGRQLGTDGNYYYFKGKMAHLRVYNTALSQPEIKDIMDRDQTFRLHLPLNEIVETNQVMDQSISPPVAVGTVTGGVTAVADATTTPP